MLIISNLEDLTLYKWNKITKSEKLDLKYLINKPFRFLAPVLNKRLNAAYMKVINQFSGLNTDLLKMYISWQAYFTALRIDIETKEYDKYFKTDYKIKYQDLETSFKHYIREFEKHFVDFEITEYSFTPDYVNKFKEVFKIDIESNEHLKKLHEFKDIRFYTVDEYNIFLSNYLEIYVITRSDLFFKNFIIEKKVKIEKLESLDDHLLELYTENNMYDKYQFIRVQLFDMNKIHAKPVKKGNLLKDIASLNTYLGVKIDLNTSVAEYENYKEIAKSKLEQQKPNDGGN